MSRIADGKKRGFPRNRESTAKLPRLRRRIRDSNPCCARTMMIPHWVANHRALLLSFRPIYSESLNG
jgi:hypothetical protein